MDFLRGSAKFAQLSLHVARDCDDRRGGLKELQVDLAVAFQRALPVRIETMKVCNQRNIQLVADFHDECRSWTKLSQHGLNSVSAQEAPQRALLKILSVEV